MRPFIAILLGCCVFVAAASEVEEAESPPKWGFLGDDESLRETFHDTDEVLLVCIYGTELKEVRPPFARVVHFATVIKSLKGVSELGDKIEIQFMTDSLPLEEEERTEFVETANRSVEGDLRFVFGEISGEGRITTEFLFVPKFSSDLDGFLNRLAAKPAEEKAVAPDP